MPDKGAVGYIISKFYLFLNLFIMLCFSTTISLLANLAVFNFKKFSGRTQRVLSVNTLLGEIFADFRGKAEKPRKLFFYLNCEN